MCCAREEEEEAEAAAVFGRPVVAATLKVQSPARALEVVHTQRRFVCVGGGHGVCVWKTLSDTKGTFGRRRSLIYHMQACPPSLSLSGSLKGRQFDCHRNLEMEGGCMATTTATTA